MKLRAIGTGSKFCKHPLNSSSFIITSGDNIVLVGVPWGSVSAIEKYGYNINNISVITFLSPQSDQISGLSELAVLFRNKKTYTVSASKINWSYEIKDRDRARVLFRRIF
jgi:hypothetical protein